MIRITDNFTFSEFEYSKKANELGIDNSIPEGEVRENIIALAKNLLQPLRDKVGPLIVSSGYRCPELNEAVGGKSNSQHLKGEAADITPKNISLEALYDFIVKTMKYDQCLLEKSGRTKWIHISWSRTYNRRKHSLINV